MSLSEMEKQKAAEAYGQVMDIIHRFEGGRSRHLTSEEVKNELLTMLQGISIINFEFTGLHNIVRGRVLDEGAAPFSNLQELTARRHEDVKGYGRCNRPGVSALYASNNLTTALSELRAHMGQRIQFIEASMKPEAKIGMLCVGIVDYCRRHRIPPPILGTAVKEHIFGHQKIAGEANWPRVELIDAFIAQQFRKQVTRDYDYNITSAYAQLHFEHHALDGLVFPSVGHVGGWNFSISPEAFNRAFIVTKSYVDRVRLDAGYGIYVTEPEIETTNINGNTIQW